MRLTDAATEYFYSKDLTSASLEWYHYHLDLFFAWCREQGITDTTAFSVSLLRRFMADHKGSTSRYGEVRSSENVHGTGRVVRNFLNFCEGEGWLTQPGMARHLPLPRREQHAVAVLTASDFEALFRACKQQKSSLLILRDTAIVAVLADTGIRANELLTLTLDRVDFGLADAHILVKGKGRKEREATLGKRARLALHRYISARPETHYREVFLTRLSTPLGPWGLNKLLHRLGAQAKLKQDVHAHLFRHSFAYHYVAQQGDVSRLSRLLGHTSLAVTDIYLRSFTAHEARRGSVSLLDLLL